MALVGSLYLLLLTISICTGDLSLAEQNHTHGLNMSSFFTIMEKWLTEIEINIEHIKQRDIEVLLARVSKLERRMNVSEATLLALEGKMTKLDTTVTTRLSTVLTGTELRLKELLRDLYEQKAQRDLQEQRRRESGEFCQNGTCKNATTRCGEELEARISELKKLMEADLEQQRAELRKTMADFKMELMINMTALIQASANAVFRKVDSGKDSTVVRTADLIRIVFLGLVEKMYGMEKTARDMVNATKSELVEECEQVAQESVDNVTNTFKNAPRVTCTKHGDDETCEDLLKMGKTTSGVYTLYLNDGYGPLKVFCDMVTDGGGWVVLQRRNDGSENFYRNWMEYERGFGEPNLEYWLGNLNIHRLTRRGLTKLRVDLQAWDEERAFARYSHFSVGDATTIYKLNVSGYSGTAGDSMLYNSGAFFSTWDSDHDLLEGTNCAGEYHRAGWWHKGCTHANLNGPYIEQESNGNAVLFWDSFRSTRGLKFSEMKIRSRK